MGICVPECGFAHVSMVLAEASEDVAGGYECYNMVLSRSHGGGQTDHQAEIIWEGSFIGERKVETGERR